MTFLKKMRMDEKMKQQDLAEQSRISASYISMIERGKRRPSVEAAKRLGAALGFDWTLFFEEGGEKE